MRQRQYLSIVGILLSSAYVSGCDTGREGDPDIVVDVPASSRIGNVATADLRAVGGSGVSGTAVFADGADSMLIEVTVSGLSEGDHGIHLHENGDCGGLEAAAAGDHFSPDDNPHGAPASPSAQHHAGDLGNLQARSDGTAELSIEDSELAFLGEYSVVGRAVIVHRQADDLTSQPAGDSGDPVACGVVAWGSDPNIEFEIDR